MAGKDIIRMSLKELRRLKIIQEVTEGKLTQKQAAEILGLSERQVRRSVKRLRQEGVTGLAHRLRNQPSKRKLPEAFKKKVLKIYEEKYLGFGPTLAQEKLLEIEGLKLSKQTLWSWLLQAGFWSDQLLCLSRIRDQRPASQDKTEVFV